MLHASRITAGPVYEFPFWAGLLIGASLLIIFVRTGIYFN